LKGNFKERGCLKTVILVIANQPAGLPADKAWLAGEVKQSKVAEYL